MTLYPSVFARAQVELDSVLGPGTIPRLGVDEPALPYLMAIVKECMRWGVVFPFSLPHTLAQNDVYRGYQLPKDTIVLANVMSVIFCFSV